MSNKSPENTSQDYDRKHAQDHISQNPRTAKDNSSINKDELKQYPKEDKREVAREEHTHFTNRSDKRK
jgi:hypothetical protein